MHNLSLELSHQSVSTINLDSLLVSLQTEIFIYFFLFWYRYDTELNLEPEF
jgi:hypothetical protein